MIRAREFLPRRRPDGRPDDTCRELRHGVSTPVRAEWLADGRLKAREHMIEGLARFADTLSMLFDGSNHRKLVPKVDHGST